MSTADQLRERGEMLMQQLALLRPEAKITYPAASWRYRNMSLSDDIQLELSRWRRNTLPAYLILYFRGKYVFELELSMLVYSENTYTWFLKKGVQNKLSREVVIQLLGPGERMPDDYRELMLGQKAAARSGADTPRNGYQLVAGSRSIEQVAVKLDELLNAVAEAHTGRSLPGTARRKLKDAPNDDPNREQLVAMSVRQGQGAFRENLLEAYEEACAISGTNVPAALDACHIEGHRVGGNNSTENGILLRADLHTLFDKGLLRIEPETFIVSLDMALRGTHYWKYHGKPLVSRFRPSSARLRDRYEARNDD